MLFFFTVGKPHQVRTLRVQRLLAAVPLCNAWPGAKLPSPCPCPLAAQTGWERSCSGRQLLSRLRRSLRCSGLRLSCSLWELEDSSADFDSALPSSRASSGSSHFTFCIGKPGGSSSLAGRASADSSGFFSPGGRSAGLVLESSRSRLRDGDELARLLCRASRLLVLLLRRRWPWRCAGGAGTCGTVATGYICIPGEVLTK